MCSRRAIALHQQPEPEVGKVAEPKPCAFDEFDLRVQALDNAAADVIMEVTRLLCFSSYRSFDHIDCDDYNRATSPSAHPLRRALGANQLAGAGISA